MTISVNQLEGLALVVANKYKVYCNKTQEARRRKSQLQLLSKQKQRSDLRQLERTLIPASPAASASFTADLEGPLKQQSSRTGLWWSVHARLDIKRKCLLFTAKSTDPSSAAQQAVALSRYVLCHELPEHREARGGLRAGAADARAADRDALRRRLDAQPQVGVRAPALHRSHRRG